MQVREYVRDEAVVVECRGSLTFSNGPQFLDAVRSVQAYSSRPHVVVDLSMTESVDSGGLGHLLGARKFVERAGGRLYIAGAAGRVQQLLELTNLDLVLRPYSSVEGALADCAQRQSQPTESGDCELAPLPLGHGSLLVGSHGTATGEGADPEGSPPEVSLTRRLTVQQVASMIEVGAFATDVDRAELRRRCAVAAELGASAVVCRPEHVGVASRTLDGTGVGVGAAVGGYLEPGLGDAANVAGLLEQVSQLRAAGATQVGLVVRSVELSPAALNSLAEQVRRVAALAAPAVVKVALPGRLSSIEDLVRTSRTVADAGAGIVSAGTWLDGDRAPLRHLRAIRDLLPSGTLLKWTTPVASLDRLLLAHAEGVDLFSADIEAVCAQAQRRVTMEGIRVPLPGRDYSWDARSPSGSAPTPSSWRWRSL